MTTFSTRKRIFSIATGGIFDQREANGRKVFWGRGNGWVLGGLAEILKELPAKDKNRKFYEELFVKLCTRVAKLQNADGFWHASLLDPASTRHPKQAVPRLLSMLWLTESTRTAGQGYFPSYTGKRLECTGFCCRCRR